MSEIYESENGIFTIEVSDDKFNAFLTINGGVSPEAHFSFINEQELIDLLEKTQISYGFENATEHIERNEIKKTFNQPFPLAIGVKSKDPEIEFSPIIDTEKSYHPTIGNQFHLLKNLVKVSKGEPLAHLFITKKSESGINIYGEEVNPENYENQLIEQYLGDNVTYSNERGQIIAEKSGYPWMDELSRIHIQADFTLDRNIDLSFEDMDFFGNLIVNGDITDKVKLRISGDLTVYGDINDADIEVSGSINVDGSILNCKNPGVIANNSISFNSAENSKIIAGDKINFKKNIHFCKVTAEKGLYGDENNSSIVGGVIQSGEHIEAAIIGNTGGINSEVEISISPYTKDKMLSISKKMMKLKELDLNDTDEYYAYQDELNNLELILEEEINSVLKNQDNLPKHIMVFKKVFPGTYIRILKKSMHISEEFKKVSFSVVNGDLISETY